MSVLHDERGMVLSWFLKMLVGFALVAVIVFDGGSVVVNFFGLDSTSDEIALELSDLFTAQGRPTEIELERQGEQLAAEANARLVKVEVGDGFVRVHLRRRAASIVLKHIGPLKDWTIANAEGQAGTP